MSKRLTGRLRRKLRVRKKVSGTAERPRLSVFRSAKHIYAQAIDDVAGRTLAFASSREQALGGEGSKTDKASAVGRAVAERLKEKGVERVVFDRNGYRYHGRVKAVAEAAREAGLDF